MVWIMAHGPKGRRWLGEDRLVDLPQRALTAEELDRLSSDFDHHGQAYRNHRVQLLAHMRSKCPFAHSAQHGGYWIASDAKTVLEVARNVQAFSNYPANVIPILETTMMIPLNSDPPELFEYRSILLPLFGPQKMKDEAPEIRATADRLIDTVIASGEGDIVADFAQPLTGITTLRLLGIDPAEWYEYAHPLHELVYSSRTIEERRADMAVMIQRMRAEIRRQLRAPKGGIIEYLHHVEMMGRKLSIDEIDSIVLIMLGGGLDTAQALVGSAAVYLGRNPDRRQELIDEPELMEGAIEEFLRLFAPTQGSARRAKQDVMVGDQLVKEGEFVFMSWVGANYDPTDTEDPETVDFRRLSNRNFSFGIGPHRCLGSHLARWEIIACLEALLAKAPNYRLVEEKVELAADVGTVSGYRTVTVRV
jgi:cytochrome P450